MKITVIGQWGGFPEACEATAGYLIQEENFNLLLDCGSGVLSNLQRYIRPEALNAVILTHYHHDHIADIGPLQYAILINTMLGKTSSVLEIYGHNCDEDSFRKLTMQSYTKGIPYLENDNLEVGPFKVSFCRTQHQVPCFAVRLQGKNSTVVFTGDTAYFENLVSFSKGADFLMCECSFYGDQNGNKPGHINSLEAGELAKKAGVKELLLTHLPHFGDHKKLVEEAGMKYSGKIQLASLGYTWKDE